MVNLTDFDKGWLLGLIEGEGCFSINLFTNCDNEKLKKVRFTPLFKISLCASDKDLIFKIKDMFGFGSIDKKPKEHWFKHGLINSQDQYSFKLQNVKDCKRFTKIFKESDFKSSKKNNYILWKEGLDIIYNYDHLTKKGMIRLSEIRDLMNKKVKSKNYRDKNFVLNIINNRSDLFVKKELLRRKNQAIVIRNKKKD